MPPDPHTRPLRIELMGTRGVPAKYGGFETAVEEIGSRLADRGHAVTVYCRRPPDGEPALRTFEGMELVTLPALRSRSLETLSNTALSVMHSVTRRRRPDAVFLFNSANSVFLPALRLRRMRTAVHVDGLEWRRSKWSGAGRRYYRMAESLAVRWADALIADAQGIADYYREEFDVGTDLIAYGAPVLADLPADLLADHGLESGRFHLVVARFEPENHVELIVRGYRSSRAELPLVVVGGAPYSDEYTASIKAAADGDPRIRLLGTVWDQNALNQMYGHAVQYIHGHSVGGTNPSLLRAMGAGAAVSAFDVVFNREVIGDDGRFFGDAAAVADLVDAAESDPDGCRTWGEHLRERVADRYQWDAVADRYEDLARRLSLGQSQRGEATGRRTGAVAWQSEVAS